jgi:transposase, IS5 family
VRETGRRGLPAESVLRCALLKQQRQLCYEELAFHLEDSASFRAFARLPLAWSPKKSVLHHTIAAIRAETWEAVNQTLLASAKKDRLESGAMVRLDSTVTAALMHEPSDSALLWDAVRVMTRLLERGEALAATPAIRWRDRRRLAKKRARAIEYSRGPNKKRQLYRDLITAAQASRAELRDGQGAGRNRRDRHCPLACRGRPLSAANRARHRPDPTPGIRRRTVPAGDKLVSLFEPHADIIVKGGWQVQYGHKLNLTTGKSGLILDVVIEAGNPADAERFVPMLDRHIARTGAPPRQTAADGGYASRANLAGGAKQRGVTDVAFHKKCGIAVADMVKSLGSIAACATSAPGSRPASPASSAPMARPAAPGGGCNTSRPTSGPRSWSTT